MKGLAKTPVGMSVRKLKNIGIATTSLSNQYETPAPRPIKIYSIGRTP